MIVTGNWNFPSKSSVMQQARAPTSVVTGMKKSSPHNRPQHHGLQRLGARAATLQRQPLWQCRAPSRLCQSAAGASSEPEGAADVPAGAATSRPRTVSSSSSSSSCAPLFRAPGQVALLAVALAGLILLPAQLSSRLAAEPARAAAAYCLYLLFFSTGTIVRVLRYGQLAPRRRDAQVASRGSRLAFALFLAAVPAGHFAAWWDPSLRLLAGVAHGGRLAPLLLSAAGLALMLMAWALNAAAAAALGKGYDRLVPPDELVTNGPYRAMQHPIYTSYMLLFCGLCLSLGSPAAMLLLWAACLVYYGGRTSIEERLLEDKFGDRYRDYRSATGRFVPRRHMRRHRRAGHGECACWSSANMAHSLVRPLLPGKDASV